MLLVAHGEDRPVDGARAGAGKKLLGQKPDDLPLLRTRILRLVDQHVIDALIELVMHPGRAILAQQGAGLVDQIVVVEQPALVLRPLVAGDHRIGDGEERGRAVTAGDGLATLHQGQQPVRFALEAIGELGTALLHCPGDQALTCFEFVGEENPEIDAGAFRTRGRQRIRKPCRLLLVAL